MSSRRRLAFVLLGLPVAFYAYACSSDSGSGIGGKDDAGDGVDGSVVEPGTDSSTNPDTSTGTDSSTTDGSITDAGDAGDGAVVATCVGNPLTGDGGTADGGANLDAGVAEGIVAIATGNFLDGPQWVDTAAGGYLAYSEFDQVPRVLRVAADGGDAGGVLRTSALSVDLRPTGNAIRNGLLLTLASDNNGGTNSVILQTAFDGGLLPTISLGTDAGSPNDLVVGKNGNIYFTDPRYQANGLPPTGVFSTAADGGGLTRFATFTGGEKPNGIALSPDGTRLYVAFTDPKRVDWYPVAANGTVSGAATNVIATANLLDAPDGIAVDVAGNIYVAEADADGVTLNGRVEVFRPNALGTSSDRWGQIPLPGTRPTAVAFGGVDRKLLFITYETGIRVYKGRCAGLPQN